MTRIKPTRAIDVPEAATLAHMIATRDLFMAPKIDGFRCLILDGVACSRTLKPFPNPHIQARLSHLPHGTDGEVWIGDERAPDLFSRTQAGLMSKSAAPVDVRFRAFDSADLPGAWLDRMAAMQMKPAFSGKGRSQLIFDHEYIASLEDLTRYEDYIVSLGYEGVVIRDGAALYGKGLWRMKRFATSEARIISYSPNGQGGIDKLTCQPIGGGELFYLTQGLDGLPGQGLTGQIVSYNHFPHGAQERPRHATCKGLRPALDLIA